MVSQMPFPASITVGIWWLSSHKTTTERDQGGIGGTKHTGSDLEGKQKTYYNRWSVSRCYFSNVIEAWTKL